MNKDEIAYRMFFRFMYMLVLLMVGGGALAIWYLERGAA